MGTDELKGLRELLAKATKGPWEVYDAPLRPNFPTPIIEIWSKGVTTPVVPWSGFDDSNRKPAKHKANAALIVAAVNTLPALIECAEALKKIGDLDLAKEADDMEPDMSRGTLDNVIKLARKARAALSRLSASTESNEGDNR